jgi:hypothetical protein
MGGGRLFELEGKGGGIGDGGWGMEGAVNEA